MSIVFRHLYKFSKAIVFMMVSLIASISSVYAEKFSACGDTSIWSAYLIDKATDEVLETYYPEDFFTEDGGQLPGYDANRDPYVVPEFIYAMQSCDLDSFEINFRFRYADSYVYDKEYRAVATIWFTIEEEFELDFDEILRSKTKKKQISLSAVDSGPQSNPLRYANYEQSMSFVYKNGVIYKSGGGTARYNICTLDQLGLTWDYLGGMITYMSVRINDKFYEEDFTDCSNAMKYEECPPKEPDFIKIICEEIPDCRKDKYMFRTESNLNDIHWLSLDGLSYDGDALTIMQDDFQGGCIAVWAQKDACTPPVYDTICPPKIELREKETEASEEICWNEPFFVNGKRVMKSGVYDEIIKMENGCDSIIHYEVKVNTADTIISDTLYRCGIKSISNSTFIKDTIEVEGGCPNLEMTPLGAASGRNHVQISKVNDQTEVVSVDVSNNLGNITYITKWMGKNGEESVDGTLTFDKAGTYKIIAIDEVTGCKDSASFYHRPPVKPDFYFDPTNSEDHTWDVAGIENYTFYRIYIFDRYGKLLKSYKNEFDGWDGTYNGRSMPSTDYWYSIEIDEGDYSLKGHFTLIRSKK